MSRVPQWSSRLAHHTALLVCTNVRSLHSRRVLARNCPQVPPEDLLSGENALGAAVEAPGLAPRDRYPTAASLHRCSAMHGRAICVIALFGAFPGCSLGPGRDTAGSLPGQRWSASVGKARPLGSHTPLGLLARFQLPLRSRAQHLPPAPTSGNTDRDSGGTQSAGHHRLPQSTSPALRQTHAPRAPVCHTADSSTACQRAHERHSLRGTGRRVQTYIKTADRS